MRTFLWTALTATLAALAFIVALSLWRSGGERFFNVEDWLVAYDTPVGVALVFWIADVRAQPPWTPKQRAIVIVTIAAALLRGLVLVPLYSGHALFLTFALWTARSIPTRVVAAVVAVHVLYFKLSWDDSTWIGGLVLGTLAAGAHRRCAPRAT